MSNVIQFSPAARVPSKRQKPTVRTGTATVSRVEQEPERLASDEGALTVTCKNKRLREDRRERWWEASAVREYWKARLQLAGAISNVQRYDLPEGDNHPQYSHDERFAILQTYREAIVKQLLTPAPDVASITWKRAALASDQHRHIGVKAEKIERAIAQDLQFLAAHPTRRKIVREQRHT